MPRIEMGDSLRKALAVLRRINVNKADVEYIGVETYCNGREQGFALRIFPKRGNRLHSRYIMFAEARSSDELVIVWTKPESRVHDGNIADEDSWQHRRVYHRNIELASYVVEYMVRQMLKDGTPDREQVQRFIERQQQATPNTSN